MSDFKNLEYKMLQCDMGQIVDVSYAVDDNYLYRKHFDKSDNTTSYSRAILDIFEKTGFEPQNNQLPEIDGEWQNRIFRIKINGYDHFITADDMNAAYEWCKNNMVPVDGDADCVVVMTIQEVDFDKRSMGEAKSFEFNFGVGNKTHG